MGGILKKSFFRWFVCFLIISSLLTGCIKEKEPPKGQFLLLGKGGQMTLVSHWLTAQEKRRNFDSPSGQYLCFLLKGEDVIAIEQPKDLFSGETGRKIQIYREGRLQEEREFSGPFWFALDEERENGVFQWKEKDLCHYLLWNFKSGEKQELSIRLPKGFKEIPGYLALEKDKAFLLACLQDKAEVFVQEKDQIRELKLPEEFLPVSDPAPYSQAFFRMAPSPDGERLALYGFSNKDKSHVLYVFLIGLSSGRVLRLDLTQPWDIPGRLSWSPDGKHFMVIYSADSVSEATVFTDNGTEVLSEPCFSAYWLDSKWILVVEWNCITGGRAKFIAVSLDGTKIEIPNSEEGFLADLLTTQ